MEHKGDCTIINCLISYWLDNCMETREQTREESAELSDLQQKEGNGTISSSERARLDELRPKDKKQPQTQTHSK